MSYFDPAKATTPGVLDTTTGDAVSAHLLHQTARTANLLREKDAPMASIPIQHRIDGEGIIAIPDWRVVHAFVVPTRPIHTRCTAHLRVVQLLDAEADFRVVLGNRSGTVSHVGTDLPTTLSVAFDIEPGAFFRRVEIQVRSLTGGGDGSGFGSPTSFGYSAVTDYVTARGAYYGTGAVGWGPGGAQGNYIMEANDGTATLWRRRLTGEAQFYEELSASEVAAANQSGVTFTITQLPTIEFRAVHLLGQP